MVRNSALPLCKNSISEISQLSIIRSFFDAFQCGCAQFVMIQVISCKIVSTYIWCHLLYRNDNLRAYVAALFITTVIKLLRARGADERKQDSTSSSRWIESARAEQKYQLSKPIFIFFS